MGCVSLIMEMWEGAVIFVAGFVAGFINAIAGGGSLLTFPILVMMGLPPDMANGTNRVSILLSAGTTALGFRSKGFKISQYAVGLGLVSMFGALLGVWLSLIIDPELFKQIFAVLMVLVVLDMLLRRKGSKKRRRPALNAKAQAAGYLSFFFVGIYGGFIQAGVGILILLILDRVNRLPLVRSNVIKTVVVFFYTMVVLAAFHFAGLIEWKSGLVLAFGSALGGWISSRWSVKQGEGIVRWFMMAAVTGLAIKLLFF